MMTREPVDQVVRKREFRERHPEVTFDFDWDTGYHLATWPLPGGGTQPVADRDLGTLLDLLERNWFGKTS